MALTIMLVDDEKHALDELAYILNKLSGIKVVGMYEDSMEALEALKKEPVDLVFLDIDMPRLSGLDFAKQIKAEVGIVFATAYDDHAIKAFELGAMDYILKPYDEKRIEMAVAKVKERRRPPVEKKPRNKLAIWQGDRVVMVAFSDIIYVELLDKETLVVTADKQYAINEPLSSLEEKLSGAHFFRTHRAFLVNLDKIVEVSPYFNHTLMLKLESCTAEIPVSRSHVKRFKEYFAF